MEVLFLYPVPWTATANHAIPMKYTFSPYKFLRVLINPPTFKATDRQNMYVPNSFHFAFLLPS